MPQLDQVSFMSQVFWFIIMFYTLYSFILIYLLPVIFRILKQRVYKFEKLIFQINLLNLYMNEGNKEYINLLIKFSKNNLNILNNFRKNYDINLWKNQKLSYKNLNNISNKTLEQIIFRKIKL